MRLTGIINGSITFGDRPTFFGEIFTLHATVSVPGVSPWTNIAAPAAESFTNCSPAPGEAWLNLAAAASSTWANL